MSDNIIDKFIDHLSAFLVNCVLNSGLDEEIIVKFKAFFNSKTNSNSYLTANSPQLWFKCYINRDNGCKLKGDFSVHFPIKLQFLDQYLGQFGNQLVIESRDWTTLSIINYSVIDCRGGGKRIQLFVCRPTAVQKLIQEFNIFKTRPYDKNTFTDKWLIISTTYETKTRWTAERVTKVSESVSKLINTSPLHLNYKSISDDNFDSLLTFAQNTDICEISDERLVFHGKVVGTDSSHLTNSLIIDKTSKPIFELMYNLYELLQNDETIGGKRVTVVMVIVESLSHRLRQSFRLMCLLYNLDFDLKLIAVSNVNCQQSYDEYLDYLNDKLRDQNSDSTDISAENFEILIDTSMALSLLTAKPSLPITRLDPYLSEATFIQYNCGRLNAIMNRYDRQYAVNAADSDIDYSLLTHDLEWVLVFNCLTKYKSIISSSVEISVTSSQVILFLKEFVRDVSVYYKKVKVLTEPSPHLKSLIATRVAFCRLILQVITNCLHILGLKAVKSL